MARKAQQFDSVSLTPVDDLTPRSSVMDFAKLMEYRLAQHDNWNGWSDVGLWSLYDQLQLAYNEAYYALAIKRYGRYENAKAGEIHTNAPHADVPKIARYVAEQYADIANYAMMIAENALRMAEEYNNPKK